MPLDQKDAKKLIERRSDEWRENVLRWRWLLDSLEGGQRYRLAVYGRDRRGLPVRNLARHKREYPDPREYGQTAPNGSAVYLGGTANGMAGSDRAGAVSSDQYQYVDDDDYSLRHARTPVPTFVAEVAECYVAKVFGGEVTRAAPESPPFGLLRDWWADVDGRGTTVDEWVSDVVAPLLLTLGQLDLYFDSPAAPPGEEVRTRADVARLGLDRCVASYVLPENMVWWKLDRTGAAYEECLYLENGEAADWSGTGEGMLGVTVSAGDTRYRHWTAEETSLYDGDGNLLANSANPFGVVPVRRVFDRRRPRCKNVGISLLEPAAEIQREYYNRDSELILSDTVQAHPLLQGPEDFVTGDGTIPVGPAWLLPKKKHTSGTSASYEGFEVVEFPKDGADSLRQNKADLRDALDRMYALVKPAGASFSGGGGNAVAQSGVSKAYDHDALHARLSAVSKTLARAERVMASLALTVLTGGEAPEDLSPVTVTYPTTFSLRSASDLAELISEFQALLAASGEAPETEWTLLTSFLRKAVEGLTDEQYEEMAEEVRTAIGRKSVERQQAAEGGTLGATRGGGAATGGEEPDGDEGEGGPED